MLSHVRLFACYGTLLSPPSFSVMGHTRHRNAGWVLGLPITQGYSRPQGVCCCSPQHRQSLFHPRLQKRHAGRQGGGGGERREHQAWVGQSLFHSRLNLLSALPIGFAGRDDAGQSSPGAMAQAQFCSWHEVAEISCLSISWG